MNILFIDDTEQIRKRYVGIGGAIFRDDCVGNLFSMFRGTKEVHGIPPEEEIKWSPDRDSWIAENLIEDKRISAYSAILDLVRIFGGTEIVAVVRRDITSFDVIQAKWRCIEFVTERFQFFLQAQEDKNGIIIADFPGSGKDEKKLLSDYYQHNRSLEVRQKGTGHGRKQIQRDGRRYSLGHTGSIGQAASRLLLRE